MDETPWRDACAPSLADFEVLAREAWDSLPDTFRHMCGDVVFCIEDFAAEDVLREFGMESPFELSGLYQGTSLDKRSLSDLPRTPDMVFLYRRALLDEWAEGEVTLRELVTHVLVHEVGHHFGLSDDDMARIEAEA